MKPKHILVIRLSAMGDVAMTIPVLQQLLQQNPQLRLTILTQPFFTPLFEFLERTSVYPVDTKGKHKGVRGIFKLYREIRNQHRFDAVADLHNVIRSKLVRSLFKTAGTKTAAIDKGRKAKRQLTATTRKILIPLKTTFQRYADVFHSLGLQLNLDPSQRPLSKQKLPASAVPLFTPGKRNICIAPFAKHREKMYPPEKMKTIIKEFSQKQDYRVFLLGGGNDEAKILNEWEKEIPNSVNLAGRFTFREELAIISNMDLLVSMDSANMHLASLFGIPVVSVWGATHPFAGFYGWGQADENAAQIDLYCRPCSVFGNNPCYRGDHACMQLLPEEMIKRKITGATNG